jgi:hypothetical protein
MSLVLFSYDTAVKICRAASRTWDDCHAECKRVGRECRDECL